MFEEVIEPLGNLGFAVKSIKEGTKITHDGKSLNTYKKIIEIKQDPAGSTIIVKDEADQAIGTIASITDANNIVLAANCASVSAVNKDLYVLNPIEIRLTFEK